MSDVAESFGEDIPGQAESDASIQERLKEMQARAGEQAKVKAFMKKSEGKAKKAEDTIIAFLITCIQSHLIDDPIIEALNKALAHGHSAHLLIAGLELLYLVEVRGEEQETRGEEQETRGEEQETRGEEQTLVLRDHSRKLKMAVWLGRLEEASYENSDKSLQAILQHPKSLASFFEVLLRNYKNSFPETDLPQDLVETSRNIVITIEKLLEKFIQARSLEKDEKN